MAMFLLVVGVILSTAFFAWKTAGAAREISGLAPGFKSMRGSAPPAPGYVYQACKCDRNPVLQVARVPYICTSVWPQGASLPSALALRVLSVPSVREVAQYRATVPGLEPLLPSSQMRGLVRPPPPLVPFDQIRIEDQLAASIEELESKRKKKDKKERKERRRSRSGEKPMKHLDFLHKINDVIKDLERDAPEVMAKVAKEEEAKQWNTSYPSKADYNAAADPIAM